MDTKNFKEYSFFVVIGILLGIMIGFSIDNEAFLKIASITIGIGVVSALLEFFLQFCYQEGNIFGWYRTWLDNHVANHKILFIQQLYNPLGGCAYCQNTWLTFGVFLITHFVVGLSWWMAIPAIVVSHLFLSLLDGIFWR